MRRLCVEDGQAAVEYAILAALISIVAVSLLVTLGGEVKGLFQAAVEVLS
jgi:Flp pilus assembly pilin Flp